jgi:hypothetical protein
MAVQARYLCDESDHLKREQGMAESQGDLEATSSVALQAFGVFWAMTQCIMLPAVACQGDFVESGMGD